MLGPALRPLPASLGEAGLSRETAIAFEDIFNDPISAFTQFNPQNPQHIAAMMALRVGAPADVYAREDAPGQESTAGPALQTFRDSMTSGRVFDALAAIAKEQPDSPAARALAGYRSDLGGIGGFGRGLGRGLGGVVGTGRNLPYPGTYEMPGELVGGLGMLVGGGLKLLPKAVELGMGAVPKLAQLPEATRKLLGLGLGAGAYSGATDLFSTTAAIARDNAARNAVGDRYKEVSPAVYQGTAGDPVEKEALEKALRERTYIPAPAPETGLGARLGSAALNAGVDAATMGAINPALRTVVSTPLRVGLNALAGGAQAKSGYEALQMAGAQDISPEAVALFSAPFVGLGAWGSIPQKTVAPGASIRERLANAFGLGSVAAAGATPPAAPAPGTPAATLAARNAAANTIANPNVPVAASPPGGTAASNASPVVPQALQLALAPPPSIPSDLAARAGIGQQAQLVREASGLQHQIFSNPTIAALGHNMDPRWVIGRMRYGGEYIPEGKDYLRTLETMLVQDPTGAVSLLSPGEIERNMFRAYPAKNPNVVVRTERLVVPPNARLAALDEALPVEIQGQSALAVGEDLTTGQVIVNFPGQTPSELPTWARVDPGDVTGWASYKQGLEDAYKKKQAARFSGAGGAAPQGPSKPLGVALPADMLEARALAAALGRKVSELPDALSQSKQNTVAFTRDLVERMMPNATRKQVTAMFNSVVKAAPNPAAQVAYFRHLLSQRP
jgi:hypothetical protein